MPWFDSGDAWKLLVPRLERDQCKDSKKAVLMAINKRIIIYILWAKQEPVKDQSWHLVVKGVKIGDSISDIQKERMHYQSRYLYIALCMARCKMGNLQFSWKQCCDDSISTMNIYSRSRLCYWSYLEVTYNDAGQRWFVCLSKSTHCWQEQVITTIFSDNWKAHIEPLKHAYDIASLGKLRKPDMYKFVSDIHVLKTLVERNRYLIEQDEIILHVSKIYFSLARGLLKEEKEFDGTH